MKMLSDYELFRQLCHKRKITVQPDILGAVESASSTGILRLPCQSIVLPVCEILGRVLSSSSTVRSLDLSDCMLISKGLSRILEALTSGSTLTTLNLKGNNIAGPIVSQLGEIFHRNHTLRTLNIEWNSLGTDTECFTAFCEGLSSNNSLEELDLRYNQISPLCAEALSKLLTRNKSLKILNLGRNNLGVQGGQAILTSMRENTSLIKLNLRGNCIPEEILAMIEDLTLKNQSREIQSLSNISRSLQGHRLLVLHENRQMYSTSDESVEKDVVLKKKKVKQKSRIPGWRGESTPLRNHQDPEPPDDDFNESILSLNIIGEQSRPSESGNRPLEVPTNKHDSEVSKIAELNRILQERSAVISTLMKEIATKNEEMKGVKSLVHQLEEEALQAKTNSERAIEEKVREIEGMRESQRASEEAWRKVQRQLEENQKDLEERSREWEGKARRYEGDVQRSSAALVGLRERFLSKSQQYEEVIANCKTEVHRVKGELRERVNRHKIEINVLKRTLKETTEALEECQLQLQKSRAELREVQNNFSGVMARIGEMEGVSGKYLRLEEAFQKLKEEKIVVEEKFTESQRTIASLKRQVGSLETELIEPQRRHNLLKEELETEREKTARLKEELAGERTRLKEQDCQVQKMCQQISGLNEQMSEAQRGHAEEIRERERERKQLKEIIASKDRDLRELRAEEAQRAGQLYAAFTKYLGSIGSTAPL
ncbi:leucine-rich repeat-containing protein 45 [Diachasma alloeum]|uniref:leucine-rich repeat-containing protein 45 n=1 Tax=Diachasma alloeum TaxID=454923 RepID=UPI0007381A7C|nr:leucine-rich repeat-containing protein 45 [Diachasma alloeum]